ncbi:hypothetical protein ASG42_27985 [Rhizobium sp. Leaf391]|nr:hypothetical protein ASG42_27985 [Rhizobium sp. Leaf391]
MENASRAFLDAVRKSMRQIRTAIGSKAINPDLLTAAERIQYQGYLDREDTNALILDVAKSGVAIKEIVRRTGHSRSLVRRILRGQRSDRASFKGRHMIGTIGIILRFRDISIPQGPFEDRLGCPVRWGRESREGSQKAHSRPPN